MNILKPKLKKPQTGAFDIPSIASVSPEYVALVEKRFKVLDQLNALERDISSVMERMHQATATEAALLQQARVSAILDDEAGEAAECRAVMGKRISELQDRATDLRAALAELDRRINDAKQKASQVICGMIEPQHRALVLAMVDKLRELHEAHIAYWRFTQALHSEDISWTRLGVMHPNFLGAPTDHSGRAAHYFFDAARLGFIQREDIPKEFIR